MRRTIFLAGVLIATAMVTATVVHAALRGDAPPAGSEARPALKVTEAADGTVTATWTKLAGQDSYQLIYDTSSALRATTSPSPCSFDPTEDCYPPAPGAPTSWPYPANGVPLNCYDFGGAVQTECVGDLDQADAAVKATLFGLSVGKTYYFQVLVADHCFTLLTCSKNSTRSEYWSNVVALVVKAKAAPKPTPKPKPKPKKKP